MAAQRKRTEPEPEPEPELDQEPPPFCSACGHHHEGTDHAAAIAAANAEPKKGKSR
jgi:hypothetical protein